MELKTYNNQFKYWVNPETGEPRQYFDALYQECEDPWGYSDSASSFNNKIIFYSELCSDDWAGMFFLSRV